MITRRALIKWLSLLPVIIHLPMGEPEPDSAWHHAYGVFSANDARVVSLDGVTRAGTLTLAPLMSDPAKAPIQGAWSTFFCETELYDWAWWNVALTNAEIAALASGISPSLIRPQNLIAYWPLPPK